jgi:hypothetical protein
MNGKTIGQTIWTLGAIPALALCLALPAAPAAAAPASTAPTASTRSNTAGLWIHIHVRDARDARVAINLPVSMVESLAGAIPVEARGNARLRFDDDDISVAELRKAWRELRNHPDATFLTVDEADSNVRVAKQGRYLVVRAHERRGGRPGQVEMKIPGAVVDALLAGTGEQIDLVGALRALARHGEGELVTVDGSGETVRIWVDRHSEGRAEGPAKGTAR